jgi:hypothetical protein
VPRHDCRRRRPQALRRKQRPGRRPLGAPLHRKSRPGESQRRIRLHPPGIRKLEVLRHHERHLVRLRVSQKPSSANLTVRNPRFSADFTGDNCRWKFKTITGAVTMEADYKMTGKLLVFPINGHGKCKNVLCKRRFDS